MKAQLPRPAAQGPPRLPILLMMGLFAALGPAVGAQFEIRTTTIDLQLEPASGTLNATAKLGLVLADSADDNAPDNDHGSRIELLEELVVSSVECALPCQRAELRRVVSSAVDNQTTDNQTTVVDDESESAEAKVSGGLSAEEPERPVARYRLLVEPAPSPGETVSVEIRYTGVVREEWQRGEKTGEIHNFAVDAHVGEEGIYLSEGVSWYPRRATENDEPPDLVDFEIRIEGVPGMLLVASGNRRGAFGPREVGASEVWRSPFALSGLSVAGGALQPFFRQVGGVGAWVHLSADQADKAETLLDALQHYLELYQPLIGPLPFREVTVVENFFSSGFAYPGFTLLAKAVIAMGEGSLRPGYLDHELLHNWWGNGVLGTPGGSIWSEALTSYCANLMRPVLEGDAEQAGADRRSILERLSRLDEESSQPLATYGLTHGASRLIGYQKGSLVFAQLAKSLGQEGMWYALRNLATTRMGRYTGWGDIEAAFERASGEDLRALFEYWVEGSELPDLSPASARWDHATSELVLELREPVPIPIPGFELEALDPSGKQSVAFDLQPGQRSLRVPLERQPSRLEIDPRFETIRRIPAPLWMPSIAGISRRLPLQVLRGETESDDAAQLYDPVIESLRERYQKSPEDFVELQLRGREIRRGPALESGHLFAVGDAAATPQIRQALAAAGLVINTQDKSFVLDGEVYASVRDSVLACVRRPDEVEAEICAYWGNSSSALARSYLVTFYGGDSLLVFENGRPVLRRRFAPLEIVTVE